MRCCSLHACLLWATDLLMQDRSDAAVGGSHCSSSAVLNLSISLSVTSQRLATAAGQPAAHTWNAASRDSLLATMLARHQLQAAI